MSESDRAQIVTGDNSTDPHLYVEHGSIESLQNKYIRDKNKLSEIVKGARASGKKVGTTIGSWDLLHIGHLRYLVEAKRRCQFLVVGVDSDQAIKLYKKNEIRPYVPEDYRAEMLCYQSIVDLVCLIDDVDEHGKWQYDLLRIVQPDIFIGVEDSYSQEQREEIAQFAGLVRILPRQAQDLSTTKFVGRAVRNHMIDLANKIEV